MKNNIKYLLYLTLFLMVTSMTAQKSPEVIQKEIDQTVWKPFKKAFETVDGKALNNTYAERVLRVTPEGIDTKDAFKRANFERFSQNKKDGVSISLDFWFDDRKTNQTTSYEVGFYRIGFTLKGEDTQYSYGQFHIVLEKLEGFWKITQDWDTTEIAGQKIDKAFFERRQSQKMF